MTFRPSWYIMAYRGNELSDMSTGNILMSAEQDAAHIQEGMETNEKEENDKAVE